MSGQYNFDTLEFTYYRDRSPAFEDFKTGKIDFWAENRAVGLGDAIQFRCAEERPREEGGHSGQARRGDAGIRLQHCAARNFKIRACGTRSTCFSISKRPTRSCSTAPICGSTASSRIRICNPRGLPEGRELEILNEIKSEVPPEVFTTEWKNPVNAKEGDYRKHQQEALKLFEAAGWKISSETATDPSCGVFLQVHAGDRIVFRAHGARSSQRQGRADDRRIPDQRRHVRADHSALCAEPQGARHQRDRSEPSTTRNTSSAKTTATSTSSSTISRSRIHPATSSAISGDRPRPTKTEAAIRSASRIPPSTSWSTRSCSRKIAPISSPRPTRSIAFCCGIITSFRNGIIPTSASPIGIFSAGPAKLPSQTSAPMQVWWIDAGKTEGRRSCKGKMIPCRSLSERERS